MYVYEEQTLHSDWALGSKLNHSYRYASGVEQHYGQINISQTLARLPSRQVQNGELTLEASLVVPVVLRSLF